MNKEDIRLEELRFVQGEIDRATRVQWKYRTVMLVVLGAPIGVVEKQLFAFNWILISVILLIYSSFFVSDLLVWRKHIQAYWKKSGEIRNDLGFSQGPIWPQKAEIFSGILFSIALSLAVLEVFTKLWIR